ncbi:MAG: riboflavin synthase [Gemmatimonadota bacterium]
MFTGLIECRGRVVRVEEGEGSRTLHIQAPTLVPELTRGQSIAVDGVCQTVVELVGDCFAVQAVGATLGRTTLGEYVPQQEVNLERSLAVGDRLDGHLVQGHVDGVGRILGIRRDGDQHLVDVEIPPEVWRHTLLHGSITLDGISLTVNRRLPEHQIQVAVIPHTWEVTTLSLRSAGDGVNVEGDLIGKYVGNLLSAVQLPSGASRSDSSHSVGQ